VTMIMLIFTRKFVSLTLVLEHNVANVTSFSYIIQ